MSEPAVNPERARAALHKLAERYAPPPARGRWHCVDCWWNRAVEVLRAVLFCTEHR